jgi:hypothetical protein
MCLDRKDVRFKLAAEMHEALTVLAECEQVDIGEYVETVMRREIKRRLHEASLIHDRTARLGITGSGRESPGFAGSSRELQGTVGKA